MKLTYTIQVCNESRKLFSLLNFLQKVIDDEDEVNVVVDIEHATDKVERVLEQFKERINIFKRPFDDFCKNSQFHTDNATGEYIFGLDADEMPQETLIKNVKKIINESKAEIIFIPRINIHPGITQDFIDFYKLNLNEFGWINWPDMQGRIYKNAPHIKWSNEVHTKLHGSEKVVGLQAEPRLALWHIKSMEKQVSRWRPNGKSGNDTTFSSPSDNNLYDTLM